MCEVTGVCLMYYKRNDVWDIRGDVEGMVWIGCVWRGDGVER